MVLELVGVPVLADVPDVEVVFIPARSQVLVELVVFQPAHLLFVLAELDHHFLLAQVPVHDVLVA